MCRVVDDGADQTESSIPGLKPLGPSRIVHLAEVPVSTRLFSRAHGVSDRALFWNGLCVALIALAIVTVFIDALPANLSIGLCVFGVAAGLVGIPLYVAQLLGGRRSGRGPMVDGAERSTVMEETPVPVDAVLPPDAVVEGGAVPGAEPEPGTVAVEAPGRPAGSDLPPDPSRAGGADAPLARCSCHGLPDGSAPNE